MQKLKLLKQSTILLVIGAYLLVGSVLAFGDDHHGHNGSNLPHYTESELEEAYQTLSLGVRQALDVLPPKQRAQYLTAVKMRTDLKKQEKVDRIRIEEQRRERERLEKERQEAFEAGLYEMDPLLKKAWDYFADWKDRECGKSIELFNSYLAKNPDSPFKAEIYYRIGSLYSTHRNSKFDEKRDREKTKKYWEMAHELYGDKFSHCHKSVWASLANYSRDVNVQKEYLDWLLMLQKNASDESIYPYAMIGQCLNGRQPVLDKEGIERRLENMIEGLPNTIEVASRNFFYRADTVDLIEYANSYPDLELGKKALASLGEEFNEIARAAMFETPYTEEKEKAIVEANAVEDSKASEIAGESDTAEKDGIQWWFVGVIAVSCISGVLVFLARAKARNNSKPRDSK